MNGKALKSSTLTEKDWEETERTQEDEYDDFCINFTKQKGDVEGWFYQL